jgi:hypothetical protein
MPVPGRQSEPASVHSTAIRVSACYSGRMQPEHLPPWVDAFLVYAFLAVLACTAADWWIGTPGRQKLQSILADWWLRIEYVNWRTFGREEALFADQVLVRLFGRRLYSIKRLISSLYVTLNTLGIIAGVYLVSNVFGLRQRPVLDTLRVFEDVIVLLVLFAVSISMSRLLMLPLKLNLKSDFLRLLLSSLILIVSVYVLLLWPGIIHAITVLVMTAARYKYLDLTGQTCSCRPFSEVTESFFIYIFASTSGLMHANVKLLYSLLNTWAEYVWEIAKQDPLQIRDMFPVVMAMIPTAFRMLLALAFFGSALLRTILKPLVSRLLLRFAEAEKGVLTTISIIVGGTAKLLQELAKAGFF